MSFTKWYTSLDPLVQSGPARILTGRAWDAALKEAGKVVRSAVVCDCKAFCECYGYKVLKDLAFRLENGWIGFEPEMSSDGYWTWRCTGAADERLPCNLPQELFTLLAGWEERSFIYARYLTRYAAIDALTAAITLAQRKREEA
jgi:hypothetical protein